MSQVIDKIWVFFAQNPNIFAQQSQLHFALTNLHQHDYLHKTYGFDAE